MAFDMRSLRTSIQQAIDATASNSQDRRELQQILLTATTAVKHPMDSVYTLLHEPIAWAAVITALEFNIFEVINDREINLSDLASECTVDKELLLRLMRLLAARGFVEEVGLENYRNAPFGLFLVQDEGAAGGLRSMWALQIRTVVEMPSVLYKLRRSPGPAPIIFQQAFGKDKEFFSMLNADKALSRDFANAMGAMTRHNKIDWFDYFPVQERILEGAVADKPLLVDMGGSYGSELLSFKRRFPYAVVEGSLVLQDLPATIENIKELDQSIVRMAHDLFSPQPVKGARAYFIRQVFHDFPDEKCREILKNLRPALRKGYSKLLINDSVLPDRGAELWPCSSDLQMMCLFSAAERSESQWRNLLEAEGFDVIQVWISGAEGLIEATVK